MKKLIVAGMIVVAVGSGLSLKKAKPIVLQAQALPYTLNVAWDASADATTYTCYLDSVVQVSSVVELTCSFAVATLGPHTVGVTAVNPTFVPTESTPATLLFTLKQPTKPGNVKVK